MMTFEDVWKLLDTIDTAAASLLKAAGFHPVGEPRGAVRPPGDPAECIFLHELTQNMLASLELLREELAYLKCPVLGEYRLEPFPDGRYGFFHKDGTAKSLSCGRTIEAKIPGRYGRTRWTRCRIEHDGSDYYLWGHKDIPLNGLTIREREVAS